MCMVFSHALISFTKRTSECNERVSFVNTNLTSAKIPCKLTSQKCFTLLAYKGLFILYGPTYPGFKEV